MSETTTTTAATPMIIASSVSAERSLCAQMAETASFSVSMNFMVRVYYGRATVLVAHRAARGREDDRLDEELPEDVGARRADGLADADLLRPFRHAHQHDVHHADASDHQGDEGDGRQHEPRRAR